MKWGWSFSILQGWLLFLVPWLTLMLEGPLPADYLDGWPVLAVHKRDGDFPSLYADRMDHNTGQHCSHYMFQWPFDRNSNNSTGRTIHIPISS